MLQLVYLCATKPITSDNAKSCRIPFNSNGFFLISTTIPQRNLRVISVITGEIKSKIDQIWNSFWSGGISNPLEVMEQMTYLLFIRRLDEIQITKEKKANRLKPL